MTEKILRIKEVGRVTQVKKNIAIVEGLSRFMNGQLLTFDNGAKAMIMGFSRDRIQALILHNELDVFVGQEVINDSENFYIPVGPKIIGRVVNGYAQDLETGKFVINQNDADCELRDLFSKSPEVLERQVAYSPFYTGNKIIDTVLPLSKGQRQLLVGDRMTGKSSVAVDTVLNQKDKNVVCVYCCVGKSFSAIKKIIETFEQFKAFEYTTIVAAGASSSVSQQYLSVYTAATIGEYFMYRGRNVFVVFDDLTKHAWAYRQLSLLMERVPGRQAYPGDIFYIHSQLMERAGQLNQKLSSGSMTFMPIIETTQGNIADFIPSNVISMTDGQVYFNSILFNDGFKPAIDILLSVSRIGNKNQSPILKNLAAQLRYEYSQYRELLKLTRLRTDLSEEVQEKLKRGNILSEIFMQNKSQPVSWQEIVIILYAYSKNILADLNIETVKKFIDEIYSYILKKDYLLIDLINKSNEFDEKLQTGLNKLIVEYFKEVNNN